MRTPHEQVKFYRERADELRAMASDMLTSDARNPILRVASEYDALALKAELRAAKTVRNGSLPFVDKTRHYFEDRAEELRTMATDTLTSGARDAILRVASEYDDLAVKAERREKAVSDQYLDRPSGPYRRP